MRLIDAGQTRDSGNSAVCLKCSKSQPHSAQFVHPQRYRDGSYGTLVFTDCKIILSATKRGGNLLTTASCNINLLFFPVKDVTFFFAKQCLDALQLETGEIAAVMYANIYLSYLSRHFNHLLIAVLGPKNSQNIYLNVAVF